MTLNFQPVIDNLPTILVGIGFMLWALARFVEAKAKANPEKDKWDEWAPRAVWASKLYSEAIDWLCKSGVLGLEKEKKLEELNRLTRSFEAKVLAGNYLEAVNDVIGYWQAAKTKIPVGVPPVSVPPAGSQVEKDSGKT